MLHFICLYSILSSCVLVRSDAYKFNCYLPERCRIEGVYPNLFNEKGYRKESTIMCDINDEFEFNPSSNFTAQDRCYTNTDIQHFIFEWTSPNELNILETRFNFTNAVSYIRYLDNSAYIKFWDIIGFDVNIRDYMYLFDKKLTKTIEFENSRLDFYHNKRRIDSCQDFIDLNITKIESIFQISMDSSQFFFLNTVEYKRDICPFVFSNMDIVYFVITDNVDTFYKKNVLRFSSEIYTELNSSISCLMLERASNINLDLNLMHPSVFNYTFSLLIRSGFLNSIDGEIFRHLESLSEICLNRMIFRKINHKQGIKWIKQMNHDINVDVTNISDVLRFDKSHKDIIFERSTIKNRFSVTFPDEDFCLYVDFPFNKMVIFFEIYNPEYIYVDSQFTCTFLWLVQYYKFYYKYLNYTNNQNERILTSLMVILNSTAFDESILKCNFPEKISVCNKSNYQIEDIWDQSDFVILNRKLLTVVKVLLYPIVFLGLITNLIVVHVILRAENRDLFRKHKQYSYLCLNSIFCVVISVIELFSWLSECYYPYEIFCPEIRKLVTVQFFKIIFKECFVTVLRFMCNFTYVAFAINRIGLIGNDHGKFVTFISELGIKKYLSFTLLISLGLSWIKFFKYEVNYFYPNANFPISNEMDIIESESSPFNDFYYIFNSICDFVNYLFFVVVSAIIDICMVVILRRTLKEKAKRLQSMKLKQAQSKKVEGKKAVNKAIQMVVLNSAVGIFFKLPVSFIPLVNVYAQFYYKNRSYKFDNPSFDQFYSMLLYSGFYAIIRDASHLLFSISLFIQTLIYNSFDKKVQTGYKRLLVKQINCIRKTFLNRLLNLKCLAPFLAQKQNHLSVK